MEKIEKLTNLLVDGQVVLMYENARTEFEGYGNDFVFYINEKAKTMVGKINEGKETYKVKCAPEDKFDVYTGFALIIFAHYTHSNYGALSRIFESFAPRTKSKDPALDFIRQYAKEMSGLDKADLEQIYKNGYKDSKGNVIINLLSDCEVRGC